VIIEYDTAIEDVDAWYRHYLKLPRVVRGVRLQSFAAALSTGTIVAVLMLALSKDIAAAGIVGGLLFVVVWALMGAAIRGETLKRAKRAVVSDPSTPALGPHILEVTPTELIETCSHHKLSVRWDVVESIGRTDKHLFLLLRGQSAMIIPFRSFSSDAARQDFVEQVERLFSVQPAAAATRTI
jgi:YcxB-like protein